MQTSIDGPFDVAFRQCGLRYAVLGIFCGMRRGLPSMPHSACLSAAHQSPSIWESAFSKPFHPRANNTSRKRCLLTAQRATPSPVEPHIFVTHQVGAKKSSQRGRGLLCMTFAVWEARWGCAIVADSAGVRARLDSRLRACSPPHWQPRWIRWKRCFRRTCSFCISATCTGYTVPLMVSICHAVCSAPCFGPWRLCSGQCVELSQNVRARLVSLWGTLYYADLCPWLLPALLRSRFGRRQRLRPRECTSVVALSDIPAFRATAPFCPAHLAL